MKTLADIADDNGTFAIIAMDQRNTLRRMFDAVGEEATPEVMAQAKVDVAANLSPMLFEELLYSYDLNLKQFQ